MNNEYYLKRLVNYLRLSGSKSLSTFTVYQNTLNLILKQFPEPEKADLLQIQEFALTFHNDNTRKNICVVLRWLFNKCLNQNIQWYELPYPKKKQKVQPLTKTLLPSACSCMPCTGTMWKMILQAKPTASISFTCC